MNIEKQQRKRFIDWYESNGKSRNSARTISTSIAKARLKNGRAVFSITDFNELNDAIIHSGLDGYFHTDSGDYSKMDAVFDVDLPFEQDDLKSGIKHYLDYLQIMDEISRPNGTNAPTNMPEEQIGGFKTEKNIILYGPPGTGKTYSSVLHAVSIVEERPLNVIKREDYGNVFARYLKYKDDGLVAFTTFHQSYGYEEFIEGIRPVLASEDNSNDSGEIKYDIRNGVFKEFCNSIIHGKVSGNEETFERTWGTLVSAAQQNGNQYIFTRRTGSQIQTQLVGDTTFRVNWQSDQNAHSDLTMTAIVKQWLSATDRNSLPVGGNRWLYDARQAVIDELTKKYGLKYVETPASKRNRVFIIDEINRGNISKIFGELITLIESSKRIGAKEQSRAILPYSGQNFGVPENVYIIGTMNTADRSIALIDTALRRRFSFVEMQPEPAVLADVLVDGIDIAKMLDTLNNRITVLLDREHAIGHSYFMSLKDKPNIERLAKIFEEKIIPLLQEYFYDDYEKIQLVLGDNQKPDDSTQFIVKKNDAARLFGHAGVDFPEYYEINNAAFMRVDAYAFLR